MLALRPDCGLYLHVAYLPHSRAGRHLFGRLMACDARECLQFSLRHRPTVHFPSLQVLFPYAAKRLRAHLEETYGSAETAADIDLLRQLV